METKMKEILMRNTRARALLIIFPIIAWPVFFHQNSVASIFLNF